MKKIDLSHHGAFMLTDCTPQEAKKQIPEGWSILAIFAQGEGKIGYAVFNPVHELPMYSARDREIVGEKMYRLYKEQETGHV